MRGSLAARFTIIMDNFSENDMAGLLPEGFSIMTEAGDFSLADFSDRNEDQTVFPILPVRNMVMFPGVIIPVTAGREQSKKLLEEAKDNGDMVGIISQKSADIENPAEKDLFSVGTVVKIIKIIKLPDGNTTAIVRGMHRFRIKKMLAMKPYMKSEISPLKDAAMKDAEMFEALMENIKDIFAEDR